MDNGSSNEIQEVEDNSKKNPKKENLFVKVFKDYCSNTSIHGIRYLGADDNTLKEKLWWLTMFIISVTICGYLIMKTWTKWQENPVIVSFAKEQIPIWDVPFPTITICPLKKVEEQYYDYNSDYNNIINLQGERSKKFWDVSLVCNLQFISLLNAQKTTDEEALKHITEVAPKLLDTLKQCRFRASLDLHMSCKKFFSEQLTSEGLCFTFNSLGNNDMFTDQMKENLDFINHNKTCTGWTVENGYLDDDSQAYPERTAEEGLTSGLSITLNSLRFNYSSVCGDPVTGFKILLHNPAETPRVSQQYMLIPTKKKITIAVTPEVITTSKGLLNIPSNVRNCYFSSEKKLRFFKIYTQNNCKVECITNVTKDICACVPFHAPRDNNTEICSYGSKKCLNTVKGLILKYENMIKKNNIDEVKHLRDFKVYKQCKCLPSCASLDYNVQISQADYHVDEWMNASLFHMIKGSSDQEATHLEIFFKESQFLPLHRNELYGQTDFIAYSGGLLGLFMGFSVLSFVEIIYFATLRLWRKFREK